MAKFSYVAVQEDGATVEGVEKADTQAAVRNALLIRGLSAVEIKPKKGLLQFQLTRKKVSRADLMLFSRQLAAFIRAGVPILDALQTIGEESGNPVLSEVLADIRESLGRGETMSDALARHEKDFPAFYLDMVRSAELTGRLDYVLDQLSRYIERDLDARRRVKSALAYPAVILVMSAVTIVVLSAFVLPRFRVFFKTLGAKLPLPTRLLLAMTDFMTNWWWAVLAVFILIGIVSFLWVRTPRGRRRVDGFLLKIPLVGDIIHYAIIERFCRILGSMVSAGVPLPDAMTVVGRGTGNMLFQEGISAAREQMLIGEGLSRPIARTGLFPPSATQMMRVGEDTGTLDQQLETAAGFYDQELTHKIARLTTLFEPAVIIFMGVVVGFVAIALVSAMYGIFRESGNFG